MIDKPPLIIVFGANGFLGRNLCYYLKKENIQFEAITRNASSKLITRDSVNMIIESLSCKGKTYLLDMLSNKNSNKVVMTVNKLIKNKNIGYIENGEITKGITKMKLHNQNAHYEVFAEVEKVAYEINKRL